MENLSINQERFRELVSKYPVQPLGLGKSGDTLRGV